MSDFSKFKEAIQRQFSKMEDLPLFVVDATKDELWNTYLQSFPDGTNPIFKERAEHDCNCCKQFIRDLGKVVAVKNNELISVWDIKIPGFYQEVADGMAALIQSKKIMNTLLRDSKHVGTDFNHHQEEDGTITKWEHFYCELPKEYAVRKDTIGPRHSTEQANKHVFQRSMEELTLDSAEIVMDLINQNSLYRGAEHKAVVQTFIKEKKTYNDLSEDQRNTHCWVVSLGMGGSAKIKNTVIGTLLADISEGVELDAAVSSFEAKVAPLNYKRPTALITQGMIAKAQDKVAALGLSDALPRRYAVAEDLTINNVLFADRSVKPAMNVFDELAETVAVNPKKFSKVEEVNIDKFINDVLPSVTGIELLVENKHINNMVSLISPVNQDVNPIFKWGNNFSWAYAGEVTDSIKERVKQAGGNVTGVLRCSLSWFNYDDLDISVVEPSGNRIFFNDKVNHATGGRLDVDMNANVGNSREAVENITWPKKEAMLEGKYKVVVHNYSLRETNGVGFDAEIEHDGVIHSFHYPKAVGNNERVTVAEFTFSKQEGISFLSSLESTQASKEAWGITTNSFQKVNMVMNSPNHWDGEETGNKHWFFMLEDCRNDDNARGFFNEFLRNDLNEHRKVFEVLGSKMKAETSDNQLSGLGFSSTQSNSVTCRITGKTNRTIKITF